MRKAAETDAAREIKGLIGASAEQVVAGVRAVGAARATLERIIAHVEGINTAIAASAAGQSEGVGQINAAVNLMDQMTQQNAAIVE